VPGGRRWTCRLLVSHRARGLAQRFDQCSIGVGLTGAARSPALGLARHRERSLVAHAILPS
jgi:hypothetical protein